MIVILRRRFRKDSWRYGERGQHGPTTTSCVHLPLAPFLLASRPTPACGVSCLRRHRLQSNYLRETLSSYLFLSLIVFWGGCTDTGQHLISIPISSFGVKSKPLTLDGGWTIEFSTAKLAIGPIYFCATAAASSDLCPTSVAEFADVGEIDLIDARARQVGELSALTGEVRSATYDYGINWFATQTKAKAANGAIRGHSAYFEGTAKHIDNRRIQFSAAVDVTPQIRGERAVVGHLMRMKFEEQDSAALHVTIDPYRLWQSIEVDEFNRSTEPSINFDASSAVVRSLTTALMTSVKPTFSLKDQQR